MTKIAISSILSAFNDFTIGSKVMDKDAFISGLTKAIEAHDFSADRVPGQGFLVTPELMPFVSAGDGLRTEDPGHYTPVLHRGSVELFLIRARAGEVNFLANVVYTLDAYAADPEVSKEELASFPEGTTHVAIAVIASSGPEAPLTPHRLVSNLAGGNKEALAWTKDEIHAKADATNAYWQKYAVVAG